MIYFIMSSFLAGSLHPCAGHFIAEHFVWDGTDQETYSYYGPLNILAYNVSWFALPHTLVGKLILFSLVQVGYHNEHHDFPSVPWTRLPKLRALVPEIYDAIPSHPSWPMVTFNFIFDKNVGLFSRVKRLDTCTSSAKTRDTKPASETDGTDRDSTTSSGADETAVEEDEKERLVTERAYADDDVRVKVD